MCYNIITSVILNIQLMADFIISLFIITICIYFIMNVVDDSDEEDDNQLESCQENNLVSLERFRNFIFNKIPFHKVKNKEQEFLYDNEEYISIDFYYGEKGMVTIEYGLILNSKLPYSINIFIMNHCDASSPMVINFRGRFSDFNNVLKELIEAEFEMIKIKMIDIYKIS